MINTETSRHSSNNEQLLLLFQPLIKCTCTVCFVCVVLCFSALFFDYFYRCGLEKKTNKQTSTSLPCLLTTKTGRQANVDVGTTAFDEWKECMYLK